MNNDGIDVDSSSDTCLHHSSLFNRQCHGILLAGTAVCFFGRIMIHNSTRLSMLRRVIEDFYYDGGDDGIALKSGMCDVGLHLVV